MSFAITVNDDACHTLTFSKNILAYQSEAAVSVTVTVPAGVKALGNYAWLDFILPDGTEVYKGHYDPSGGSFIVTLGATDTILDLDGRVGIQFVLRDALDSPTVVWRSETKYTKIGTSINATVHAASGVPAPATFPDLFPAEHTSIADAGLYYAGTTAEDALQEVGSTLANHAASVGYASPIGEIKMWPAAAAPTRYLLCDGSVVNRVTYADLFALIGTTYGVGDNSTTFNLPNLKGKVVVGYNAAETEFDALGETGGEKTHVLTVDEMPSHNHSIMLHDSDSGTGYPDSSGNVPNYNNTTAISNTGGGLAHNNLQPYIAMNYIIRALD